MNEKHREQLNMPRKKKEHAWERIIGPPWDSNSDSAFIIWTIFWTKPCIAVCNIEHLSRWLHGDVLWFLPSFKN